MWVCNGDVIDASWMFVRRGRLRILLGFVYSSIMKPRGGHVYLGVFGYALEL